MKDLVISARIPEKKNSDGIVVTPQLGPVSVTVQSGETAEEMIQMFGSEAVITNAVANWAVTLQAGIRAGLKKGETAEQIQARLAGAKMGVAAEKVRVDPVQAYLAMFAQATPEKQSEMLRELQERAQA
jgi:hypothetical protein